LANGEWRDLYSPLAIHHHSPLTIHHSRFHNPTTDYRPLTAISINCRLSWVSTALKTPLSLTLSGPIRHAVSDLENVMVKLLAGISFAFGLIVGPLLACPGARADEGQVDLLLVLAADVSRSVDERSSNCSARALPPPWSNRACCAP
jgi:hypothetical protein